MPVNPDPGEMTVGATSTGIGKMLAVFYSLHEMAALYAAILLIGFAGLLVEEIVCEYIGNRLEEN